jgi:hypothetical protein
MSVFEMATNESGEVDRARADLQASYETSPFAAASLFAGTPPPAPAGERYADQLISTPFAEALATFDETDLEAEAFDALRAEFEDEEFLEALEALSDEAAARHLTAAGSWGQESEAGQLASAEAEQWMETVAARADRLLGELEAHFGDRPVDTLGLAEIDAVAGFSELEYVSGPVDAQEQFLKKLVSKAKKVVSGVGKLVKKGVAAVGKLLPLGKLFGFLKKLVRPLLEKVLQKAIGKLPEAVRRSRRSSRPSSARTRPSHRPHPRSRTAPHRRSRTRPTVTPRAAPRRSPTSSTPGSPRRCSRPTRPRLPIRSRSSRPTAERAF